MEDFFEFLNRFRDNLLKQNISDRKKVELFKTQDDIKEFFEKFDNAEKLYQKEIEPFLWTVKEMLTKFGYFNFFEEYKKDFNKKYIESADKELLIKLEIEEFERKDFSLKKRNSRYGFFEIGYLIAVNGDDPIIFNIVNKITKYNMYEYYDDLYDGGPVKVSKSNFKQYYEECRRSLPRLANGYIAAKKVQFLKELKSNQPDDLHLGNEVIPEYEFKTAAQKIAWLHELGILKTVLDNCRAMNTYNFTRAANIISTFVDIKPDTIRKPLEAIFNPNETNEKNNPLNNPDNKLFVAEMRTKFKLDKDK